MTAVDKNHAAELPADPRLNPGPELQQDGSAPTGPQPLQEIFIVQASTMYEGNDPVRAFASRESADAFAESCRDHEAARTNPPGIDAPDQEWENWYESDCAWEQAHPAAPLSRRESYDVMTLTFDPT
ncbi:hypothetical protein GR157_17250 [Burkholderia sp. 4701]|nr:hypothetical protein [Burkholderia sp. 4701]MXN83579.1 hypothetical protein [Burkholderia sp. 4812]